MSEYFFGTGSGKVAKSKAARLDALASKHGCFFVAVKLPEGARYWFGGPNRGEPFDRKMARAVLADAERAGLLPITE